MVEMGHKFCITLLDFADPKKCRQAHSEIEHYIQNNGHLDKNNTPQNMHFENLVDQLSALPSQNLQNKTNNTFSQNQEDHK